MNVTIASGQAYGTYEADFYRHYRQYQAEQGGWYEHYRPAYRYGYDLGIHTRYGGGTWVQIESEVCILWESRNPDTWEQFKRSIQYAWARASGKAVIEQCAG